MRKTILLILSFLFIITWSSAHDNLQTAIHLLSKSIQIHPDSTPLYLRRGELYTQHQQYNKAIRDFKTCLQKGNNSEQLFLAFAQCYHQQHRHRKALRMLNEILQKNPKQVQALRIKGKIFTDRKKYLQAAAVFESVLELAEGRTIENYLETAEAYFQSGENENRKTAFKIIEKGIVDLGPLLVFYEQMKNFAIREKDYEAAIHHQTMIVKYSIRKEIPYYERALLYESLGVEAMAEQDFISAQKMIRKLPIRFQQMEEIKELNDKLERKLKMID